jgi:hypothetical protein
MRKREKQIVIRLSEQELEQVKTQVRKSGMSQQDYLIRAITNREIINTEGMRAVVPELKRIGNNVNQIARSCNEGNQATFEEVSEIERGLDEVWRSLRLFLRGLQSDEPSTM